MTRRYSTFSLGGTRIAVVSVPFACAPGALTAAEADVAVLLARGLSNAQIASERRTAVRTVANQVRAILAKLGVQNRRAVARALVEWAE